MVKVITYGTYDLLHYGHIRLLERAKALGDYLIVGVTSDTFDRERGKINVQQSLMERVEAVRATGIADEIIIEEYEGQKIDDIKRLDVDIFTVGSDWRGKFDYLNAYCKVVYLDRTQGVSSTEIRSEQQVVRLGLVGESPILNKIERESQYVNGLETGKVSSLNDQYLSENLQAKEKQAVSFQELLKESDALYVISAPSKHYAQIKEALEAGKHVLCESPITLQPQQWEELKAIAKDKKVVLMDSQDRLFRSLLPTLTLDKGRYHRRYHVGGCYLHQPHRLRPYPGFPEESLRMEQYLRLGTDGTPAHLPAPGHRIQQQADSHPLPGRDKAL